MHRNLLVHLSHGTKQNQCQLFAMPGLRRSAKAARAYVEARPPDHAPCRCTATQRCARNRALAPPGRL